MKISPQRNSRFQQALQTLNGVVYRLIEERRALPDKPRDLLSNLLAARDAQNGDALSDLQLRDEVVTILIAGHETTALTLAWAWHLLTQDLSAMRRLQSEVDQVLQGRLPTMNDLPRLPWSEMVLNETMRLYPPVWVMVRKAVEDDEIAGYPIPAGAFVLVSAYTTHRHPDFWPQPEQFDPERFSPEKTQQRPIYAHFPFAGGRHLCLGLRFALIEGQMILAALAQRFELHALPNHAVVPQPVLTLRQQQGLLLKIEKRR